MIPQFLTDQDCKIEVIALSLPPNIMRSVIPGPDDHIQVHFLQILQEEFESLHGKIAIVKTAPISG